MTDYVCLTNTVTNIFGQPVEIYLNDISFDQTLFTPLDLGGFSWPSWEAKRGADFERSRRVPLQRPLFQKFLIWAQLQ